MLRLLFGTIFNGAWYTYLFLGLAVLGFGVFVLPKLMKALRKQGNARTSERQGEKALEGASEGRKLSKSRQLRRDFLGVKS